MDGYDLDSIDPTRPETYIHLPVAVVRAAAELRSYRAGKGQNLSTAQRPEVLPDRQRQALTVSETIRLAYPDDEPAAKHVGHGPHTLPAPSR